jgi:hypothetical protein
MQEWTALEEPYDKVVFPEDSHVKQGAPNNKSYPFVSGADQTVQRLIDNIEPGNGVLTKRAKTYMDICKDIHVGFTALGISRLLPNCLQFLVKNKVDRLMKYASLTVRDVQNAVLNLGYSQSQLLAEYQNIPKTPEGPDHDLSVRRLKAVLTHPIGDYAVQPRDATFAAHGRFYFALVSYWRARNMCLKLLLSIYLTSCRNHNGALHGWSVLHCRRHSEDIYSTYQYGPSLWWRGICGRYGTGYYR